ncbi:hypothetical protein [uncultured Prochlorococcus sp.]|uniref:hypothetical protein n=1 Tax=uncultured Prochlorococcus sp. TaxID=159733 RepID=UPI00258EA963|nr:hypothetical protein [uncultured Prochlorococcus sp.]
MKKNSFFIILGEKGNIGSSLKYNLALKSKNVVCINWKAIKNLIYSENEFKDFLENNYQIYTSVYNLIFINCLRENTELEKSLELYKTLIKIFKKLKTKVNYVYLSTYEPNKIIGTNYRKIKFSMENYISKDNGIIIRIGYFLPKEKSKSYCENMNFRILTNFRKLPILIPVTLSNDLANCLIRLFDREQISKTIQCYSKNYCIQVFYKFPFLRLEELKSTYKTKYLLFPFETISKFLFNFSNLLKQFNTNTRIIEILEKPYSLALQQTIIGKNKAT